MTSEPLPIETTPREFVELKENNSEPMLLVDCREPHEYDVAKIEGAILIPMGEITSRVSELESHRDARIVIHCHHGGRSLRVADFLRNQGFPKAQSMAGGIDLWSLEIDQTVPRY